MHIRNLSRITLALFILLPLFGNLAHAQEKNPNREIGLRIAGLNDFDFLYRKERKENKLTRFRLGFADLVYNQQDSLYSYSGSIGIAIGNETRVPIGKKLNFIHGIEPQLSLQYSDGNRNLQSFSVRPRVGYMIGFLLDINEEFNVSLEAIPSLGASFNFSEGEGLDNTTVSAGFNQNAVALTLAYRFKRNKDK